METKSPPPKRGGEYRLRQAVQALSFFGQRLGRGTASNTVRTRVDLDHELVTRLDQFHERPVSVSKAAGTRSALALVPHGVM